MTANQPRSTKEPAEEMGRVLPFQRKDRARPPQSQPAPSRNSPIEDLARYAQAREPDDYRQRMTNNVLAFVVIGVLAAIGVWLATTIADLRKTQDCVLSGRRNCAQIDAPQSPR